MFNHHPFMHLRLLTPRVKTCRVLLSDKNSCAH